MAIALDGNFVPVPPEEDGLGIFLAIRSALYGFLFARVPCPSDRQSAGGQFLPPNFRLSVSEGDLVRASALDNNL